MTEDASKKVRAVTPMNGMLLLDFDDGSRRELDLTQFERLAAASYEQLGHYRLISDGSGVHWPDLDEDLTAAGLWAASRPPLDVAALRAVVEAKGVWRAPWTAHTFAIDCPCPNGEHCGDTHSCVEVEAREEYPNGEPGDPAEEGEGQCVVQINVPGLETFAAPTAAAIVALRNNAPALLAAAELVQKLRAIQAGWVRGDVSALDTLHSMDAVLDGRPPVGIPR